MKKFAILAEIPPFPRYQLIILALQYYRVRHNWRKQLAVLHYNYRQPCVATRRLCFATVYLFFIFLFNSRSQKLPDRFSPNFQELCILV